jgi:hypothetical protein
MTSTQHLAKVPAGMKVTTVVLNANGHPHFETVDHLDAEALLRLANDRAPLAREQGADWTRGSVTFYGNELISAVHTGEHRDVDAAVTNMVMSACLLDTIYGGASDADYRDSDLKFVVSESGTVLITRLPAGSE